MERIRDDLVDVTDNQAFVLTFIRPTKLSSAQRFPSQECRSDPSVPTFHLIISFVLVGESFIHNQSIVCSFNKLLIVYYTRLLLFFCSPSQNENTFSLTAWTMALDCFSYISQLNKYLLRAFKNYCTAGFVKALESRFCLAFGLWKLVLAASALSFIASRYSAAAANAQVQSTAAARSAINRNSNHLSFRPLQQFHSHRRLSFYFRRSQNGRGPDSRGDDKKKSARAKWVWCWWSPGSP